MEATLPGRRDELAMELRRLKAVEGFRAGEPHAAIARRLGVSRQAVHTWYRTFRRTGIHGLRRRPRPGRPPKLTARQMTRLPAWLARGAEAYGFPTPIWTTQRGRRPALAALADPLRPGSPQPPLRRLGFSWQKTTGRARERDEATIARWVQHTWPRLKNKPTS